ncbi:WD repeat protein YBl104C-like protein [Pseudohyphozyma bogoriensis]|nr:WD repeat protein YBl104C-like protein [Pseudohyphozyma bogoriensis]
MSSTLKPKTVLWDPSEQGSDRFVVGGGAELRLYQWEHSKTSSRTTTLSVVSELSSLRTFAWSPHPAWPDLFAVGTQTGRTLLLRLDASASPSALRDAENGTTPKLAAMQINVRHSRPVNVVAFSPEQPGVLAIGLEKARGESLLVYDIEGSVSSLEGPTPFSRPPPINTAAAAAAAAYSPRNASPVATPPNSSEPHPISSLGSSETVLSAAFLPSKLLLASIGGKSIRAYDLRSSAPPVVTYNTRALNAISPNPFNSNQFASHGDDGVIRLWDIRKPTDSLLSFSEIDAAAVGPGRRSNVVSKPLSEIAWDPKRRGVMAVLEREATAVRLWNILDGPVGALETKQAEAFENVAPARHGGLSNAYVSSQAVDEMRLPVLFSDQKVNPFQHALSSFAFINSPSVSSSSSTHFIGVSRDVANPGSSGHRIETLEYHHEQVCGFLERGIVVPHDGKLRSFELPAADGDLEDDDGATPDANGGPGGRGRAFSLELEDARFDRNETPRPGDSAPRRQSRLRQGSLGAADAGLESGRLGALRRDVGVVLRERVEKGYGGNASVNAELGDTDITRSLRRGDEARAKDAAYASTAAELVKRRKIENVFAVKGSAFANQRKIALQCCGLDWEEDWELVCTRFQREGNPGAAARHAFFSGHLEKAMGYLKASDDEKLRLLAPVLAAYLLQKDALKGSESIYVDLCRTLSSDAEVPWMRAMFAYLASSDWRELVDETGLALKDRVAVALRFLSDSELLPFLQELGAEAMGSGDLEAVVLFGLRGEGLNLISNFVDRTADVQTAAIAASFVSPGLVRDDRRVERWIQSYRSTLDRLQLYAPRALFDSAQGRRARLAMEQARSAGRNSDANAVGGSLKKLAPPQLLVRCQFCATNIAPKSHREERNHQNGAVVKSSICPTCSKSLPGCSVCLTKPSIHAFEADGSSSICLCPKCRHGGHVSHILEWFERSDVCPVADCDSHSNLDDVLGASLLLPPLRQTHHTELGPPSKLVIDLDLPHYSEALLRVLRGISPADFAFLPWFRTTISLPDAELEHSSNILMPPHHRCFVGPGLGASTPTPPATLAPLSAPIGSSASASGDRDEVGMSGMSMESGSAEMGQVRHEEEEEEAAEVAPTGISVASGVAAPSTQPLGITAPEAAAPPPTFATTSPLSRPLPSSGVTLVDAAWPEKPTSEVGGSGGGSHVNTLDPPLLRLPSPFSPPLSDTAPSLLADIVADLTCPACDHILVDPTTLPVDYILQKALVLLRGEFAEVDARLAQAREEEEAVARVGGGSPGSIGSTSSGGGEELQNLDSKRNRKSAPLGSSKRSRLRLPPSPAVAADRWDVHVSDSFLAELQSELERCLARSLDHTDACPLCRADFPSFSYFLTLPINSAIHHLIDTAFPVLADERRTAIEADERSDSLDTPIFVCTLSWPTLPTFIHIFEPRYRLMMRRVMETTPHEFGMVLPSRDGGINEYGTMLRVQNFSLIEDGRSVVETIGTYRFKVLEQGTFDGYTVGRIERVEDVSPEQEAELERRALASSALSPLPTTPPFASSSGTIVDVPPQPERSTKELMGICLQFVKMLRSGSAPWVIQRLNNTIGPMPTEPSAFSFWMAEVMPVDDHVKAALLQITSPRERLRLLVFWIEQFQSSWWFNRGCEIM